MTMVVDVADQAIALGLPVFPVRLCEDACLKCNACKAPACPHGFHDASKDPAQIRQLFRRYSGQLIGTPTGEVSGFDVLDIDTSRHPEAVNWWLSHRKYISKTRAHLTGSSGLHLLFQHSPLARTGNGRLGVGVDVKSNGGYIVWWPAYDRKILLDAPPAPWPEWLLAAQDPKPPRQLISSGPTPASIAGVASFVSSMPEGQRNSATYWGLCRAFEAENQGIKGAVAAVADAALKTGLDRREVATIVLNADRTINGITR
jgi:hypothetical protein